MTDLFLLSFPSDASLKDSFLEILEPFSVSISCFENSHNSNLWTIEALIEKDIWADHQDALKKLLPVSLTCQPVPEKNWVLETTRSFPPFKVDCFYIHGTHVTDPLPKNLIPLTIDAATAFGSGEHSTTKGCLLLLHYLVEKSFLLPHSNLSLLDMGTGSGILAIAMAKLLESFVLALDNDPESIRVTRLNAQMNKVSEQIISEVSEGFQNSCIEHRKPFDLIMANILAGPLKEMAKEMSDHTKSGRFIILSGLLETQASEIIDIYSNEGFMLSKTLSEKEWTSLLLQKI